MKVSIITVTYNSEKTIAKTIESVLQQDYKDYEHIIVDGLSKDKTMEIVKSFEPKYNGKLKYISEKDAGIYDAMNKGLKMATGDVIGLLNSDDIYSSNDVLRVITDTFKIKNCDGTYANLMFLDNETMSKPIRIWRSPKGSIKNGWHPAHPTLYLKKQVYDKIGNYNLKYKIDADYDFMIRLMLDNQINLEYIDKYIVYMRSGGTSTAGIRGYVKNLKEAHQILKDNKIKHPYLIDIKRIIKTIYQILSAKIIKPERNYKTND